MVTSQQEVIDNVSEQLGDLIRRLAPDVGNVIMMELLIFHLNEVRVRNGAAAADGLNVGA